MGSYVTTNALSWYSTVASVQHRQREGEHIGHCGQCGQLAVIIPHIVLLLWLTLLGGKI